MFKRIGNILFVICVVMVFGAQTYRTDEKGLKRVEIVHNNQVRPQEQTRKEPSHDNQGRPQVQTRKEPSHDNQGRPQAQTPKEPSHGNQGRPQEQARKETPKTVVYRQSTQQVRFQFAYQERVEPRVYAVIVPAPVENNNLFHRQHHKHWRPRYNFYDNQYHFYPYVNIASIVELSEGCVPIVFNGQIYYYDRGTFYLRDVMEQYVAVPPPLGIIVNSIPANARQVIVDDQTFYRYKGVFYVGVVQGYQVVNPVPFPSEDS